MNIETYDVQVSDHLTVTVKDAPWEDVITNGNSIRWCMDNLVVSIFFCGLPLENAEVTARQAHAIHTAIVEDYRDPK